MCRFYLGFVKFQIVFNCVYVALNSNQLRWRATPLSNKKTTKTKQQVPRCVMPMGIWQAVCRTSRSGASRTLLSSQGRLSSRQRKNPNPIFSCYIYFHNYILLLCTDSSAIVYVYTYRLSAKIMFFTFGL